MVRNENLQQLRKWFIILVLAAVLCGAVCAVADVVRRFLEGATLFGRTEFKEFYMCEGPDPTTGRPLEQVSVFSSTAEEIFVCGYLEANGSDHLSFLLFYEGKSVGWFAHEKYRTGQVLEPIPPARRKPGNYRVEVHMARTKLATAEFTIVP